MFENYEIYRDIYSKLKNWKKCSDKKILYLQGICGIGKSEVLKTFGRDNFDNVYYIDLFVKDINIENKNLNFLFDEIFDDFKNSKKSLIIIDSIHLNPKLLYLINNEYNKLNSFIAITRLIYKNKRSGF